MNIFNENLGETRVENNYYNSDYSNVFIYQLSAA